MSTRHRKIIAGTQPVNDDLESSYTEKSVFLRQIFCPSPKTSHAQRRTTAFPVRSAFLAGTIHK
jgi:hypothetical protein